MAAEKKENKITVKYKGEGQGVVVPGFTDGMGYYEKKGSQHTFKDPDEIELAKKLVETNANFEEVN